ncbi:MAG: hypothetical protein V5A68_07825 [Candidatus Thermoplasmatota archaeon]
MKSRRRVSLRKKLNHLDFSETEKAISEKYKYKPGNPGVKVAGCETISTG